MNHNPVILCVDDDVCNLVLLEAVLTPCGYRVVSVRDGETALTKLDSERIDLVLLDVMMPEMDGFEVCRRIKADHSTAAIPVLFLTSLGDTTVETTGLELGAADYLVKPYATSVLLARVQTHLDLKANRDRIEELAEMRAQQLFHAERLSTLGALSAGIVHELCSPLTFVRTCADALQADMKELATQMPPAVAGEPEVFENWRHFLERDTGFARKVVDGANRIRAIMESMRKFSYRGQMEKAPASLDDCIENALTLCHNTLKYRIAVRKEPATDLPQVLVNSQHIEQVFVNILKNAADAMDRQKRGELTIAMHSESGVVRCIVEDNGPGIHPDHLEAIWDPFFTTKDAESGTGLGLSVSRGIIEEHRGRIWAENRGQGKGARFVVELPVGSEESRLGALPS